MFPADEQRGAADIVGPLGLQLDKSQRMSPSRQRGRRQFPSTVRFVLVPFLAVAALVYTLVVRSGCANTPSERAIIDAGMGTVPAVREFDSMFPLSSHFLTHRVTRKSATWNAVTVLHDRYILTMQCRIDVNSAGEVTSYDAPNFWLREVRKVSPPTDGGWKIYYGWSKAFGAAEWSRLTESDGEFASIDIVLTTDEPVEYIDQVWQEGG